MFGISRHSPGASLARHRHAEGYAAVVLAGGYVEAGDRGRVIVSAGDVVPHRAHEAHFNGFGRAGAVVLNLPLPPQLRGGGGAVRVADVDAVARAAERDPMAAAALLGESTAAPVAGLDDWPDRLARALADDPALCLRAWSAQIGMAPQSVSRGFRQLYGVSPKRYRAEQRTLRAIEALLAGPQGLAALAADLGFADQSHLTRAVKASTGRPPGRLRVQCVQEGGRGQR